IAYSPAIVGAAVLQWNAFKNFDVSFSSKYVGSQYFDNTMNAQRKLDAYWVNNLQFDYRILSKLCKEFSVRLAVNNVFNAMYSSNAYGGLWFEQGVEQTWSYYYPQAGRHFLGGIVVKF
ncbi:MAG TPA: TonB-dependent receptor, partial [Bacteroidales bacterium]|nr:TonB-dependent receptor [Bacteroidales bacterium]